MVLAWIQKNCASFFSVWIDPIYQVCTPANCLVLDTSKLPFRKREKRVYLSITPFRPFEDFDLIEVFVQDRTLHNHLGNDGLTKDREHLDVNFLLWDKKKSRHYISRIDYLPDTRLSFGGAMRNVNDLEEALKAWNQCKKVSRDFYSNELFDVTSNLSKPNIIDHCKFWLGHAAMKWLNQVGMPSYDVWWQDIETLALERGIINSYQYSGCKPEYWKELYAQGYKADRALNIGTNPQNWTGHY